MTGVLARLHARRRAAWPALTVIVLTVAASCSDGSSSLAPTTARADESAPSAAPSTTREEAGDPAAPLDWESCGSVECASLAVPLDHDRPDGESIDLALVRRPATGDAIGSLLVNPGGPGGSGLWMAEAAPSLFAPEVLDRFDVVAWDPRGVGESTAVDCVDDADLDEFFAADKSPDDDSEIAALEAVSRRLARGCEARSGDLLSHLASSDTVADMDAIRAALGDERLTYAGVSYGTYLGALYAEAYPERVRALVLDGAVDPAVPPDDAAIEQAQSFDAGVAEFLEWCTSVRCEIGDSGDAAVDYDALMAEIDAEPIPAGDRVLGPGEADLGVVAPLYSGDDGWEVLAAALEDAADGDGDALLGLSDAYTRRDAGGSYTNEQEAFYATGCIDGSAVGDDLPALAARVADVAPRIGPTAVWLGMPCRFWPVPTVGEPAPIRAAGAAPILVVGTTRDSVTPYAWAQRLADQLDSGALLTLDGTGHGAIGDNACIDDAVAAYLVDLAVPPDGTRCEA